MLARWIVSAFVLFPPVLAMCVSVFLFVVVVVVVGLFVMCLIERFALRHG